MAKSDILGIDIGTATVKVFAGLLSSANELTIIGSSSMPTTGFEKGIVTDYLALANTITQAIDCLTALCDIKDAQIYLGIGGMELSSTLGIGSVSSSNPAFISNNDVQRVCRSAELASIPENRRVLHVIPQSYWIDKARIDHSPVGYEGSQLEADVLIVTSSVMVDKLIEALKSASITLSGVVANAVVGSRLLVETIVDDCIIVDIGAGITDVSIYQNKRFTYIASLPIGGGYITKDIMQVLGICTAHAEEIKRYYAKLNTELYGRAVILDCNDYGTTDKQISYDFLHDIIESRIEEIVGLVYDYLAQVLKDKDIKYIYLTGGCSAMPSIAQHFESKFGLVVKQAKPDRFSPEYAYPSNTTGLGLMQYAVEQMQLLERKPTEHSLFSSIFIHFKKLFLPMFKSYKEED